jgi:uncharacterized protein
MENAQQRPTPIDTTERNALLDVIRGFALSGVFFANVYMWMSGAVFLPEDTGSSTMPKPIEIVLGTFVFGKFMTMFTFLFGLGLAVQFSRATERMDSASKRYVRRCAALVLLGVLHLVFLWYGDITHQYALIGLLVLLFRTRTTKTVVVWGLVLALFAVPVGMWIQFVLPRLTSPDAAQAAMDAWKAKDEAFNRTALEAFRGTSYLAVVRANLSVYWHHFVSPVIASYHVSTLGNFLLGLAVGRLGWLQDVPTHRRAFRRLFGWGLLAAILPLGIVFGLVKLTGGGTPQQPPPLAMAIAMPVIRNVQTLAAAVVYMSAIALLFQRNFFRRLLSIFAPVGRMAVSNYFAQSAIGVFVFYGIGLGHIGDLRPRWTVVMPMVMFTVQMILSWLWLRHFRFGPVEWVSRSLTYGKLQPMRIKKGEPAAVTDNKSPSEGSS